MAHGRHQLVLWYTDYIDRFGRAELQASVPYTATYKWTFTPGANASTATLSSTGADSANPSVTFGPPTSGTARLCTIKMTATTTVHSAGGAVLTETASAAPVNVTVTPLSPGDHLSISSYYNGAAIQGNYGVWNVGNAPGTITFSGVVADATGTPNTTYTVAPCTFRPIGAFGACTFVGTATTLATTGANTANPSASWTGFEGGYYVVTMTTTIGTSTFSTTSAIIYGTEIL